MQSLKITTIQTNLVWENIHANLNQLAAKISPLEGKTDLVILPEMFTTGFTNNCQPLAELPNGKTFEWFLRQAASIQAVITGSYIVKEDNKYYNRLVWMQPDGRYFIYNKHHLFTKANEHKYYTKGESRAIIHWKGWKICPLICYDLRFPIWSRNNVEYDLLIYVANWPSTRAHHWKSLLLGRAIENQAYTIGVNRVGKDGNDLNYSGNTSIIDYSGAVIYQVVNTEAIFTTSLDRKAQEVYRQKLNFLPDQDSLK